MDRQKNIFDKIGALIPGYRGYAEREGRRDCDKLLRIRISEILDDCENILKRRIQTNIANSMSIDLLESNRKQINTISSQVKHAPYGVSSFFSLSQIKEQELADIYSGDLVLLDQASMLEKIVLEESGEAIDLAISEIKGAILKRNRSIEEYK